MSETPRVLFLHLAQIDIAERIRGDLGDDEEFKELCTSIETYGQLQSIVVIKQDNGTYKLEMGERRYRAIQKLNAQGRSIPNLPAGQIRAELIGFLTPEVSLMREFEENFRRKGFTPAEEARYVKRMHDLLKTKHGAAWTQEMTAQMLNLSTGKISYLLTLEDAIKKNPEIGKASTLSSMVRRAKIVKKQEVRRLEVKENKQEQLAKASEMLFHQDARQWIKTIPDASIDLINFDPPWGTDIAEQERGFGVNESFDDSEQSAMELMTALFPELFRILKNDRVCICWAGHDTILDVIKIALDAGFGLKYRGNIPQIWYKPDKVSDFTSQRFPGKNVSVHSYETFYYLTKGEPNWQEVAQDVHVYSRVPPAAKIHRTQKPVELMESLIRLHTIPGETVLDPCAGSFAFGIAAWNVQRKALGCELGKEQFEKALTWLAETVK